MDAVVPVSMTETSAKSQGEWYVIQTLSNQEGKVKRYLDKFVVEERWRTSCLRFSFRQKTLLK